MISLFTQNIPFNLILCFIVGLSVSPLGSDMPSASNNSVTVLQWNCRNINTNKEELFHFLHSNKIDIICLQSLGRESNELPVIDGYFYPPLFRRSQNKKVSVATYVKTSIIYTPVVSPCPTFDHMSVAIELETYSGPLTIVNNYYPKGVSNPEDTKWISTLELDRKWLILGDFNAWHSDWSATSCPARNGGSLLAQHILDSPVSLLNDGSVTRYPDRAEDNPSAIDITLISTNLVSMSEWYTHSDDLGSDHVPIITRLNFTPSPQQEDGRIKYNFDRANWTQFANILENEEPTDKSFSDADQLLSLRTKILAAADLSIPQITKKIRNRNNPGWNEACSKLAEVKHRIHNRYRRRRDRNLLTELKQARAKLRKAIKEANFNYWKNDLEQNVRDHHDLGKFHKRLKKRLSKGAAPVSMLEQNGIRTKTLSEKVELQAKTFSDASNTATLPPEMLNVRNQHPSPPSPPLHDDSPLNVPFSLQELQHAIMQIKKVKKASGTDPVSYAMIKHLPKNIIMDLLHIYNLFWSTGNVPESWKEAEIIAIHKPNKPRKDPKSYRPISLTPHLSKIFERMILNRLQYQLDKTGKIHISQAGFRTGRGTTDHLVKLSSHVRKALHKRKPTVTVSFDVKGAFDQVWTNKLLTKLFNCGVTGRMYYTIQSFMTNRSLRVRERGVVSHCYSIDMGVPQGSILAPTLFSIMLHDLTPSRMKHCNIAIYADDIIIWYTTKANAFKRVHSKASALRKIQTDIDTIVNFMKSNGFQFSAAKTTFMIFKPKYSRESNYENLMVRVENDMIKSSETMKYLGITFDSRFTFDTHTNASISKTRRLFYFFKELETLPDLNTMHHKLHLVKAFVRSRLLYGQEAFYAMSESNIHKLKVLECHFLRKILNLANGTPQTQVYRIANWLPLDQEIRLRCAQYIFRSQQVQNYTSDEVGLDYTCPKGNESPVKIPVSEKDKSRYQSIFNFAEPIIQKSKLNPVDMKPPKIAWPIAPWLLEYPHIDDDYVGISKRENPHLVASEAKIRMENYAYSLHVYTDGSKSSDGKVGCAWTIPKLNKITKSHRLPDHTSITCAELLAIAESLSFIIDCPRVFHAVTIFTDSKASLQAIKRGAGARDDLIREIILLVHMIKIKGTDITLCWIPSHSGISGNDQADMAAKQALEMPNVTKSIGLANSESSSKLKTAAKDLNDALYKATADIRNWPRNLLQSNFSLPRWSCSKQLGLYNRLCAGYTHHFYKKENCVCGLSSITPNHLINCALIFPDNCKEKK